MSPLSYSVPMATKVTGLSQQSLRDAIHAGALKARRSARNEDGDGVGKFVILAADLQAYLDSLPEA